MTNANHTHGESESSHEASPEATGQLLHELRAHQIRLEMRNEELRRTQVELDASRARYFDLYDLAPVGYITTSKKGLILEANLTVATLFGVARGALLGQPLSHFILPEDQDIYYRHRKPLFETGEPHECELRLVRKGRPFWAWITATIAQDAEGRPVCRAVVSAISDRKRAEEALRRSESLLNATQSLTRVGGWEWDVAAETMTWTDEVYRIHGYSPGEIEPGSTEHIARSVEHYDAEDRPIILAAFQRCVETGEGYDLEFPFTTVKGERLWIRTVTQAVRQDGRIVRVLGNIMDITERKRAEEALRESEEHYRSLFENMLDGFAYCKMLYDDQNRPTDFVYLAVNSAFEDLTGLRNVAGKRVTEVIPGIKELTPELLEIYGRVASSGRPERFEIDFKPLAMYLSISVYSPEAGYFVAVFDNITERKRAEEALRESESRYRALFENVGEGIVLVDAEERIVSANPAAETIFGVSPGDLAGRDLQEFVTPERDAALRKETRLRQAGQESIYETEITRPDGEERNLLVTSSPLLDQFQQYEGAIGVFRDITERKRAEEALRESEERFSTVFRASPASVAMARDSDGRFTDVNAAWEDLTGYTRSEALGHTSIELNLWADPRHRERLSQTARAGGPSRDEVQIRHKSGEIRYVLFSAEMVELAGERYLLTTAQDITDRRRVEEALRDSEERFRKVFEEAPVGIVLTSRDFRFFSANPAFEQMLGYRHEEMGSKTFLDVTHPEHREADREAVEKMWRGEIDHYRTEKRYVTKDGDILWGSLSTSLIRGGDGAPLYALATIEDVTERKRAEEALRENERELALTLDATTEGIWKWDFRTSNQAFSPRYYTMLGYAPGEFPASFESWQRLFHPDDLGAAMRVLDDYLVSKPDHYENEFRLRTKSGDYRWIRSRATVAGRDESGDALRMIGSHEDITDAKRAEVTLQRAKAEWETAFDAIADWVLLLDVKTRRILRANRAGERFTGLPVAQTIGRVCCELLHGSEEPDAACPLETMLCTGQRQSAEFKLPDSERWLRATLDPVRGPDGSIASIVHVVSDITSRKQAEEELERAGEQLRALSNYLQAIREEERTHVAREIHDELGQALTALKMDLAWVSRRLQSGDKPLQDRLASTGQLLDNTIGAVQRIASDLRPGLLDDLGLVAALEWQAAEFERRMGISCAFSLDRGLEDLTLDPDTSTALFRVAQEALTNVARHAQATQAQVRLTREGDEIRLEVIDNGRGASMEDLLDRRSLGLLGMRERMRARGGECEIGGVPGSGTMVVASMPLSQKGENR